MYSPYVLSGIRVQTNGVTITVLFEDPERNPDTALLGYPVYGLFSYFTYAV